MRPSGSTMRNGASGAIVNSPLRPAMIGADAIYNAIKCSHPRSLD